MSTRVLLALATWLLLLTGGCVLLEGTSCACGVDLDAPLPQHDLSFVGDHNVADACICRCGTDEPSAHPLEPSCDSYEERCTDERGDEHQLSCN